MVHLKNKSRLEVNSRSSGIRLHPTRLLSRELSLSLSHANHTLCTPTARTRHHLLFPSFCEILVTIPYIYRFKDTPKSSIGILMKI